jgi:hypothetical protein
MHRLFVVAIIALVGLVLFLGVAVVRLENYRYANALGFCEKFDIRNAQQRLARESCLFTSISRPYWFLHLLYGTRLL